MWNTLPWIWSKFQFLFFSPPFINKKKNENWLLRYNEIQNFGPLSELDDLSYMENITFKLKTQSSNPNLQYKYGFLRALNHLTNLLYVTVDE